MKTHVVVVPVQRLSFIDDYSIRAFMEPDEF